MLAHPKISEFGSKFMPSDFFQMDEYMNISCFLALAAFAQNQQLGIHLHHQNRPRSSACEFSRGLCMSGHYNFFFNLQDYFRSLVEWQKRKPANLFVRMFALQLVPTAHLVTLASHLITTEAADRDTGQGQPCLPHMVTANIK